MSVLDRLPSAASCSRCLQRRWRPLCIFLILLVVCLTIQTLHTQPSSALWKLFALDGRPAVKYLKTNDDTYEPHPQNNTKEPRPQNDPKEPRPQNDGPPPPLVQQNFRLQQDKHPTDHPPPIQGFQQEDGLLEVKSQNEAAGNQSNDGLLERRKQNPPKSCKPKSHIVFLKTHKTASSTVQNILYRYGDNKGLIFALPRNKKHMMSYPKLFNTSFVEKNSLKNFDILCNHMRFRKSEVEKLMPEDSFYFSIVRHPVSSMKSAFMFFKGFEAFTDFTSLEDFLENDQDDIKDHLAHNTLAFDLGYDNTATADTSGLETIVNKVIAGIEKDFHLILITEYFDESMILLKHALCWSLDDVVSFKVNSRANQSLTSVSMTTAEKIKRWNILDWRIYQHFNTTFWNKVRSLVGEEKMKLEVSQLKELQAKLSNTCLEGGHAVNQNDVKDNIMKPIHHGSVVIQGYNLNPNLDIQTKEKCQRMIIPELQYNEHLYVKQFEKESLKQTNKQKKGSKHTKAKEHL